MKTLLGFIPLVGCVRRDHKTISATKAVSLSSETLLPSSVLLMIVRFLPASGCCSRSQKNTRPGRGRRNTVASTQREGFQASLTVLTCIMFPSGNTWLINRRCNGTSLAPTIPGPPFSSPGFQIRPSDTVGCNILCAIPSRGSPDPATYILNRHSLKFTTLPSTLLAAFDTVLTSGTNDSPTKVTLNL